MALACLDRRRGGCDAVTGGVRPVGIDHDAVELDAAGWTRMLLTVVLIGNRDPRRLAVPLERSAPHALGLPAGGPGTHVSVAADRHPGRSNPDDRSGHRVGCDHNQPR